MSDVQTLELRVVRAGEWKESRSDGTAFGVCMAVREHGEEMVAGVRVPREIIVDLAGYGDVGPVVQCLKPGDRLMVTGEYRRRTYTTQGGEVRNVLRCTVQAVEPVSVAGAF